MRIRKNANFLRTSGTKVFQTHVCQLNQSPWDVIPFYHHEISYPSSNFYQYGGEDSLIGYGSLGDSIGAVDSSSVAPLMEEDPEDKAAAAIKIKVDNMLLMDDNYEIERINQHKKQILLEEDGEFKFKFKKSDKIIHDCNKTGVKSCRQCKNNELKQAQLTRDYHLSSLVKSSANNSNVTSPSSSSSCIAISTSPKSIKKPEKALAGTRRGRAKGPKKGQGSSSNPYEFYYYSGFGPLWGKRRGEGTHVKNESKETEVNGNTTPFSTLSPIEHHDELDDEDEDDDDNEDSENGDIRRKRMRKPVKARSLKSLM